MRFYARQDKTTSRIIGIQIEAECAGEEIFLTRFKSMFENGIEEIIVMDDQASVHCKFTEAREPDEE